MKFKDINENKLSDIDSKVLKLVPDNVRWTYRNMIFDVPIIHDNTVDFTETLIEGICKCLQKKNLL